MANSTSNGAEAPEQTASRGRLAAKVVLVTGAASGVGRATAQVLAAEGAAVTIVTDLNERGAVGVAGEIAAAGRPAIGLRLDVTSEADWEQTMRQVLRDYRRLDVLVNNAGIDAAAPVVEMTLPQWRRVMEVNLDGVFLGTRHAMLGMLRSAGAPVNGSIINVSSASGLKAAAGASAYCASKAAVLMFSRAAALECAQNGWQIRINSVVPAGVMTRMWEGADWWPAFVAEKGGVQPAWDALAATTPLKRFATPEEIARGILFLASDDSSYMTAAELVIDGGYTA